MHQRSLKLILVAAAVATIPACYATGGYGYQSGYVAAPTVQADVAVAAPAVDATVAVQAPVVAAPQLVTVDASPTVQVFADYHEPIFFTDNTYWRYTNNNWYRSSTYTGGWSYEASVPYAVRSIDRPDRYRNYRPAGYVPRAHSNYGHNTGYTNHNAGYGHHNSGYVPPARSHNSGWTQPARTGGYTQPARTGYTQPTHSGGYTQPARTGYTQPARPASGGYNSGYVPPTRSHNSGWTQPAHAGGYTQPARPASGGYQQPARPAYQQPARPAYQQPARPAYQQPARSTGYTPPARTTSTPTRGRPTVRDHRK